MFWKKAIFDSFHMKTTKKNFLDEFKQKAWFFAFYEKAIF